MHRVIKWAAPLVALGLLLSFHAVSRAEEAAGTGGVSGTVLDPEGKPASGVSVRLFKPFERGPGRAAASKPQQQAAEEGDKPAKPDRPPKGDRPKPLATATTDAEGKFTMSDVPAGDYVIMAMVRGQGRARQPISIKAGETATVELKLKQRDGGPDGSGAKKPQKGEQ